MNLFHCMPLQKPTIVEAVQAATSKESTQIAEQLESDQTHRVIHNTMALSRSLVYLVFCFHWALHPIQ